MELHTSIKQNKQYVSKTKRDRNGQTKIDRNGETKRDRNGETKRDRNGETKRDRNGETKRDRKRKKSNIKHKNTFVVHRKILQNILQFFFSFKIYYFCT